jgi:hypothetical protein
VTAFRQRLACVGLDRVLIALLDIGKNVHWATASLASGQELVRPHLCWLLDSSVQTLGANGQHQPNRLSSGLRYISRIIRSQQRAVAPHLTVERSDRPTWPPFSGTGRQVSPTLARNSVSAQ